MFVWFDIYAPYAGYSLCLVVHAVRLLVVQQLTVLVEGHPGRCDDDTDEFRDTTVSVCFAYAGLLI